MLQNLGSPLVQTFAGSLRGNESTAMNFGRHAQEQLAGSRLFRIYTLLLAVSQIIFDCEFKLGP